MRYLQKGLLLLFILLIPAGAGAMNMESALNNAAGQFRRSGKVPENKQILIRGIVNFHSKKKDTLSTEIETQLYYSFSRHFPEVRLVDVSESLSGVSMQNTRILKGSYRKSGARINLNLQLVDGMSGSIIDQASVDFKSIQRSKHLMAVLDIEAKMLNLEQRKILSDIFREALGETGEFNLASSADVDRMNPDDIQAATGCTRDACATIIGEQLGVDRVISSFFRKLSENHYYITGKIINIQDGSILVTRSVKHSGDLRTVEQALKKLALELAGTKSEPDPVTVVKSQAAPVTTPVNVVADSQTGLVWQKAEGGKKEWRQAIHYCFELELAGKKDWRLPDRHELATSQRISERFPGLVKGNYYWSSTTNREDRDEAWGITARNGELFDDGAKDDKYYVRCVRGSRKPITKSIRDERTGLEWQRGEGGMKKWEDAIQYCRALHLAGKNDWRLPSIEELESSYDIQDAFPMLYVDGHYWSATTTNHVSFMAWGMTVKNGRLFKDGMKFRAFHVRCTRGSFQLQSR